MLANCPSTVASALSSISRLDRAFSLSVVDYTLSNVIIKLCDEHSDLAKVLPAAYLRQLIPDFQGSCECSIVLDND